MHVTEVAYRGKAKDKSGTQRSQRKARGHGDDSRGAPHGCNETVSLSSGLVSGKALPGLED